MKYLENSTKIHLMIWEVDPKKRNKNNEISFLLHETEKIQSGDVIFCFKSQEMQPCYEITEILETRPGGLKKHIYYVAKSKWNNRSLSVIEKHDHSLLSNHTATRFSDWVKKNKELVH